MNTPVYLPFSSHYLKMTSVCEMCVGQLIADLWSHLSDTENEQRELGWGRCYSNYTVLYYKRR